MTQDAGQPSPQHVEARAFTSLMRRLAALVLAAMVAVALPFGGLQATLGVLAGGLIAGVAFAWLCRGFSALLLSGASAARGRTWALASLIPRQAVLALAVYVALVPLELPALWLLAGVTAWPIAFVLLAALNARVPSDALAAGARPTSET